MDIRSLIPFKATHIENLPSKNSYDAILHDVSGKLPEEIKTLLNTNKQIVPSVYASSIRAIVSQLIVEKLICVNPAASAGDLTLLNNSV